MAKESFRERNRRRREKNAFTNILGWARRAGIPDPEKVAASEVSRLHGAGSGAEPTRSPSTRRSAGSSPTKAKASKKTVPQRLDERTKEQLYARAQELEIEGRSQMTKDELIEAIREKN